MNTESPAIEMDIVETARAMGHRWIYRVICRGADGAYGRLCHYMDDNPVAAWEMAQAMARHEAERGARVEIIDVATGQVSGAPFQPIAAPAPTATSAAIDALRLTEGNLGSLIAARHSDAVLMTSWREAVRKALALAAA